MPVPLPLDLAECDGGAVVRTLPAEERARRLGRSTAALAVTERHEPARPRVRSASPPQQQAESDWAPYPEDYVERVEIAARLLRAAYQKKRLRRLGR